MIEISNLTKTYGGKVQALNGVDLTIGAGMFGLIGPNGAGKTSLMRILAGLIEATTGTVNVFGNNLGTTKGKQASKALMGYLPQDLGLYPNLTAREFLDYIGILKGITDSKSRRQQIEEILEMVRLSDVANRKLKTYSGGMKRRAGIAQALLGHPQLIIVDEPTVGLDPEERVRLRNLLSNLAKQCTILLSSHIIEDISQSCNDLAIMSKGRVVFHGSPQNLIRQAQGYVWTIAANLDDQLDPDLSIVSTLQMPGGVLFRVVGTPATQYSAVAVTPSLEDSYIWLMRQSYQG